MAQKLVINQTKVNDQTAQEAMNVCPFGGLEYTNGKLDFTAGCKSCGICARKGPAGLITIQKEEDNTPKIDKTQWVGVAVFVEHDDKKVHPVSFELIGKAKELAGKINQPVYAVLIASSAEVQKFKDEILCYGVDRLYVYENDAFKNFNVERYKVAMHDMIVKVQPGSVLYGGTPLGRSFAPRVAASFRSGLTADCTMLDMKENSDLVQIRPAFGGNVMAQIVCPNHRPQSATVRYKIFKMPEKCEPFGEVINMPIDKLNLETGIEILEIKEKEKMVDISEADIIVACGRAFKTEEDLAMAEELADLLGGEVAVTRPLVEAGLRDAKFQIGLSGRTVAPKLIIVLGISGAVQFTAGMTGSETIITVNSDPNAPIFGVSHYGVVGDVFEIVPKLINAIKSGKGII